MQLLQHSQRLLSNLSTIFHCLLNEAHELTQKGARQPSYHHHIVPLMPAETDDKLLLLLLLLA